jgi:hypothetical protein
MDRPKEETQNGTGFGRVDGEFLFMPQSGSDVVRDNAFAIDTI